MLNPYTSRQLQDSLQVVSDVSKTLTFQTSCKKDRTPILEMRSPLPSFGD
jgi:hypothetical protein